MIGWYIAHKFLSNRERPEPITPAAAKRRRIAATIVSGLVVLVIILMAQGQ